MIRIGRHRPPGRGRSSHGARKGARVLTRAGGRRRARAHLQQPVEILHLAPARVRALTRRTVGCLKTGVANTAERPGDRTQPPTGYRKRTTGANGARATFTTATQRLASSQKRDKGPHNLRRADIAHGDWGCASVKD